MLRMALMWLGGFVASAILVLGSVAMFSSPSDSVALSRTGGKLVGYGGGSFKEGIAEVPTAYHEVIGDTGTANTVPGSSSADAQTKATIARQQAQLKAQQKQIDKLLKANQ